MTVETFWDQLTIQAAEAFAQLAYLNEESRARDVDPPVRAIRIRCDDCGAGIFQLGIVETDTGAMKMCRNCSNLMALD